MHARYLLTNHFPCGKSRIIAACGGVSPSSSAESSSASFFLPVRTDSEESAALPSVLVAPLCQLSRPCRFEGVMSPGSGGISKGGSLLEVESAAPGRLLHRA